MVLQAFNAPYALLAEVTHRCPLRCAYCSNPLELTRQAQELPVDLWLDVLDQAVKLGVVQLHLSGGEPLLRGDLEQMVERADALGLYSNLITSGVGLSGDRTKSLSDKGLNSVQLSIQAADAELSDTIAGNAFWTKKMEAATNIRACGLPLTMNVVVHRLNLHQLEDIIDLCRACGAERLELANAQYYGWALLNRAMLLPGADQLRRAEEIYQRKKEQFKREMEIIWVACDYHEPFPKPCMGGWGNIHMTVAPDGTVMPCPAAKSITSMHFDNVREHTLDWIWYHSDSFNKYRGFDWMQEPCRSCERRFEDFGGCRCQAFALTGDAAKTDPVCQWSPDRGVMDRITHEHSLLPGSAGGSPASTKNSYLRSYLRNEEE